MKKLLPLILILVFSCEEVLESIKEGCTTTTACNYDATAMKDDGSCEYISCLDCLGYPNGVAVLDSCSTCDASTLNDCTQDCGGIWGGTATTDNCENCSTSSITCELDCAGVWGGSTVVDTCNVCGGDDLTCTDCNGDINGTAYVDECQICVGGNTGQTACTTEADCDGVFGGTSYTDNCGACVSTGDTSCVLGCDGIWKNDGTQIMNDACNICGGDGTTCQDCAGTVNGTATTDNCGICDTDSSNDCSQDCNGAWGGSGVLDNCGECGGDGSSCEAIDCTDNTSDYCQDLSVLQILIDNSNPDSLNMEMDDNGNGIIEPLELGIQSWQNGRLTEFSCWWIDGDGITGLRFCGLSGEIPSEIGNLGGLTFLDLCMNQLSGEIPSEIGNLGGLTSLLLCSNQLSGEIPSEIGNLVGLTTLNLYGAGISGNQLSGEIPSEIGNLVGLTSLNLGSNQLSGEIPSEIGNLTSLTRLTLNGNELTGEIPVEIGNLTNLTYLQLSYNQLTGEIPPEIGNLTSLNHLYLNNNQLSGEIPESICSIYTNIIEFKITHNNLCPPYPSCLTEEDIGTQYISACPVQDCAGEWGGSAVADCAGVCGGTLTADCAGVCGGVLTDVDSDGFCDEWVGLTVSDVDGYIYETIQIGYQLWFKENLRVTKYKDGTDIPTGHSNSDWTNLSSGAYAVYDDDPSNAEIYGNLYNWYAVENQQLCMVGWHIPSKDEWQALVDYLGGYYTGGKMKEEGTEHWNDPNEGATNESGFTALPGGQRAFTFGHYGNMGNYSFFWTSSESEIYTVTGWQYELRHDDDHVISYQHYVKQAGFSIRCLKDFNMN